MNTCKNCKWCRENGLIHFGLTHSCFRYPKKELVTKNDFCGEYKKRGKTK